MGLKERATVPEDRSEMGMELNGRGIVKSI